MRRAHDNRVWRHNHRANVLTVFENVGRDNVSLWHFQKFILQHVNLLLQGWLQKVEVKGYLHTGTHNHVCVSKT